MFLRRRHNSIAAGQLRRRSLLGSSATYRILDVDREQALVSVEVIEAPGLDAGERFTVTHVAMLSSEVVSAHDLCASASVAG